MILLSCVTILKSFIFINITVYYLSLTQVNSSKAKLIFSSSHAYSSFHFSLDWYPLLTHPHQRPTSSLALHSFSPYLLNNQDLLNPSPSLDSYFRLVLFLVWSKGLWIGGALRLQSWEWWGGDPLICFPHSDLIETTNFPLLRVNNAMDTRAIYSKVKKILYKPHIQNVCDQIVPQRCIYQEMRIENLHKPCFSQFKIQSDDCTLSWARHTTMKHHSGKYPSSFSVDMGSVLASAGCVWPLQCEFG